MDTWNSLSTRQKVAVAVGVSAGAAVLCVFYTKYRNGRVLPFPGNIDDSYEVRMKISQHAVKQLLAGGDDVITQFSNESLARIELSRVVDSQGRQELMITGSPAHVSRAQELLSGILRDDKLLEVDVRLPARSMCRIIGQGGQLIRDISKTSGAKIQCAQLEDSSGPDRCITISGSLEQVEAAKTIIQKMTEDDPASSKRTTISSNFRVHRKEIIAVKKKDSQPTAEGSLTPNTDHSPDSFHTAESPEELPCDDAEPRNSSTYNICKFEVPSPDFNFRADEHVDVWVSASENPEHFWVQILGFRSTQLDKLTTEMSDFYSRQKRDGLPQFQLGDIVAAQFRDDSFWYRAEVMKVLENGCVDLYYVDYGDNWACSKENLFPLRSDFLSLPFQAVECCLANVAPCDGKWSAEALDAFESWSYCAKWKPLLAKIASFPSPEVSHFQVHLYDPSREPMLNIGQEMILRGFAAERQTSPMMSNDETLVSRLLEEVTSLSRKTGPPKQQDEGRRQESDPSLNSSGDVIVVEDDS